MYISKAIAAAGLATGLSFGLVTVAAPAAQAAPVTACIKKKTGELKVLLKSKKKCKKGWTKATWNETGDTGPQGPAGPPVVRNIKDAAGALVGYSLFRFDSWSSTAALIYTDAGAYWYDMGSGRVVDSGWISWSDDVLYTDAGCSAAVTPVYNTPQYLAALNSFGRVVDRPNQLTAARAFKGTATVKASRPTDKFYYLNNENVCKDGWSPPTYAVLESVAAPVDRPGPLTIE